MSTQNKLKIKVIHHEYRKLSQKSKSRRQILTVVHIYTQPVDFRRSGKEEEDAPGPLFPR